MRKNVIINTVITKHFHFDISRYQYVLFINPIENVYGEVTRFAFSRVNLTKDYLFAKTLIDMIHKIEEIYHYEFVECSFIFKTDKEIHQVLEYNTTICQSIDWHSKDLTPEDFMAL